MLLVYINTFMEIKRVIRAEQSSLRDFFPTMERRWFLFSRGNADYRVNFWSSILTRSVTGTAGASRVGDELRE